MKLYRLIILSAILALIFSLSKPVQAIVYEQWAVRQARFHGEDETRGIACDSLGNVYIAAQVTRQNTAEDYELIKYSPDGTILWRTFYNGIGLTSDYLADMTHDAAGNSYLTGVSYHPGGIATDYCTIKYNDQGQQLWIAWYDGGLGDVAYSIALDAEGNVYVTGSSSGPHQISDYATVKYNSQGVQQWVARYDGPAHGSDYGCDLAVDGEGNVYVTGNSDTSSAPGYSHVYCTIKYNAHGERQWINRLSAPGSGQNYAEVLALDAQSNVYVAGYYMIGTSTTSRWMTVKYSTDGVQQWVNQYSCPGYENTRFGDMVVDAEGSVIITGFADTSPMQFTIPTVKYSTTGSLLWSRTYRGDNGYNDLGYALAVDRDLNVYVAGYVYIWLQSKIESLILKYSPLGDLNWVARHVVDTLDFDGGTSSRYITLDSQDNVVVAGAIYMGGGVWDQDVHTIKYSQTPGEVIVSMTPTVIPVLIPAQGGIFNYDLLTVNGVDDSLVVDYWWRAVYPGNSFYTPLPGSLQLHLTLDSTSVPRTQRVPGSAPAGTYKYILCAGVYPGMIWATDTIVVTKLATGNGLQVEGWVNSAEIAETGDKLIYPLSLRLYPSHPNPFNPSTAVSYKLQAASDISLKVYDTAGRLVAMLVDGWQEEGNHEAIFDGSKVASGIYICTLKAGLYAATEKLVLLK